MTFRIGILERTAYKTGYEDGRESRGGPFTMGRTYPDGRLNEAYDRGANDGRRCMIENCTSAGTSHYGELWLCRTHRKEWPAT